MTTGPRAAALLIALAAASVDVPAAAPTIAAGFERSCGVDAGGNAYCWGNNATGSLGDGSDILSRVPVTVTGLASGVSAVATSPGAYHTCALTDTGGVLCWGDNIDGQLGNDTFNHSSVPSPVYGLSSGVTSIAVGSYHTCALDFRGGVWCWGYNASGQLGSPPSSGTTYPIPVEGLGDVVALAAGKYHTCALTRPGAVLCWGSNAYGQLGIGTTSNASTPTRVAGLPGVAAISAGIYHTCALTTAGQAYCWGINDDGQLGNGTDTDSRVPVAVTGLPAGVTRLVAGGYHTCAVAPGSVSCWGNNYFGQLGNGTHTSSATPATVAGLPSGIWDVSLGYGHSCAVTGAGTVWCWGFGAWGQLGDGTKTYDSAVPVRAAALTDTATAIAAGDHHTCALTPSGKLLCWGGNEFFQLGDASDAGLSYPVAVVGLEHGIVSIASGTTHTCAADTTGSVLCWGFSPNGQLGNGYTSFGSSTPVQTRLTSGITAVTAGADHTCALGTSGTVWCWGRNAAGQLGTGSTQDSAIPVAVSGLPPATAISAGRYHTCALASSGQAWCWGYNSSGQLGNGSGLSSLVPVAVAGLDAGARAISAGGYHTCAITRTNTVYCWGYNGYGQLGSGTGASSAVPVAVRGLPLGAVAIAAGGWHTCALNASNTILCWGGGSEGELGNGGIDDSFTPVPIAGLPIRIASLAAGWYHSCALAAAGEVFCWGANGTGGLGDATFATRTEPTVVAQVGGRGSFAAGDWFLDLEPAVQEAIPANRIPRLLARTTGNAATAMVSVSTTIQFRAQDQGLSGNVFAFAVAPASLVKAAKSDEAPLVLGWARSRGPEKDTPVPCVLAQLNAAGQLQSVSASSLQAMASGILSSQGQAVTVLDKVGSPNVAGATFYVGYGSASSPMFDSGLTRSVATIPGDLKCTPTAPQTGWWWNAAEPGRGFSVEVNGDNIFFAGFLYDASGRSTWYVATGPTALDGSYYTGPLYAARGGQTLGGAYPGRPALTVEGTLTLAFNSASQGTMLWPGGAVPLARFDIVAGGAADPVTEDHPESGWWWNPEESGRGFFMEWQRGTLDMAGYLYDEAGNSVWYLAWGTMADAAATVFSGNWWLYADGQTLTGAWRQNRRIDDHVAPVTVTFTSPSTAVMTLPNGRTTNLQRHRF